MPTVSDIAGKIFLLGEYGVLAGGPAIVAAVGPRFEFRQGGDESGSLPGLHGDSPAARLLRDLGRSGEAAHAHYGFKDPHFGAGGFGASTAQFALVHEWLLPGRPVQDFWSRYQRLHAGETVPPSGADLHAQVQGGIQLWRGKGRGQALGLNPERNFDICVLAAGHQQGRKVATHAHLPRLQQIAAGKASWLAELTSLVERAAQAINARTGEALAHVLTRAGDLYRREGLEIEATSRDCAALGVLPHVLAIKGAGAMQADALVAVVERPGLQRFADACERRDLRFLGVLKDDEPGLRVFLPGGTTS
jgi:hypothetical protein